MRAEARTRARVWGAAAAVAAAALLVGFAVFALLRLDGGERAGPPGVPPRWPAVNAALNATSAIFLAAGFVWIRFLRHRRAHAACMLAALGASLAFLVSYLAYHAQVGSVRYEGRGWTRAVYFGVLVSHSILAPVVVPLVAVVLWHASRRRFERHRAWARWTLPLWLYVSVTGVAIYWMLYGGTW